MRKEGIGLYARTVRARLLRIGKMADPITNHAHNDAARSHSPVYVTWAMIRTAVGRTLLAFLNYAAKRMGYKRRVKMARQNFVTSERLGPRHRANGRRS